MKNTHLILCFLMISCVLHAQKPKISYSPSISYTAGTPISPLIPVNSGGAVATDGMNVSTLAGSTMYGLTNAVGTAARFYFPTGMAVDKSGNIFVTDKYNHVIRKITPSGVVTTFAGSGSIGSANGQGTAASFYYPGAVVIDENENLYISDQLNFKIRKITKSGLVSTYAGDGIEDSDDGPALSASFRRPEGLVLDKAGNLYVAEFWGHKIRKISPEGVVSTLAGSGSAASIDGTGTAASFNWPCGICIDTTGTLFVAEQTGNKIRKVSPSGVVTTIAGTGVSGSLDGIGSVATFNGPSGLVMDAFGSILVADAKSNKIRKITPNGLVSTVMGSEMAGTTDGRSDSARLNFPFALTYDLSGNLLIADRYNHEIRKMTSSAFVINPALPTGLSFNSSTGIITGTPVLGQSPTNYVILARNDSGIDSTQITLTILGKATVNTSNATFVTTTSATGNGSIANLGMPNPSSYGFCWNTSGNPTLNDSILKKDTVKVVGTFSFNLINLAQGTKYYYKAFATNEFGTSYGAEINFTTLDSKPDISYPSPNVFVAEKTITPLTPINTGGLTKNTLPIVSTLAGSTTSGLVNGVATTARFNNPGAVAVAKNGSIYVADKYNHVIRKITSTGEVTTFAGSGNIGSADGQGTAASFYYPAAVALDANDNVYVSDQYNYKIRKITPAGLVSTFAGSGWEGSSNGQGAAASFYYPEGLVVDTAGNVYVADFYNHKIRKITASGLVSTFAGAGYQGSSDGTGTSASFNYPCGICIDATGSLYIADQWNNKIRKITSAGVVTTIAGNGSTGSVNGASLSASFNYPSGVAKSADGIIYVSDRSGNRIRKIGTDGMVSTFAGSQTAGSTDGSNDIARFNYPFGIAFDWSGNLIVADRYNHEIRKITMSSFAINPSLPSGLDFDAKTGTISGTPLMAQASTIYSVTARNDSGVDTANVSITIQGKPTVRTNALTSVTSTSAIANGRVVGLGVPVATSVGICWNGTGNPTLTDHFITKVGAADTGAYNLNIIDLAPGTDYYVKAYATNELGTAYGNEVVFSTLDLMPKISYNTPQTFAQGDSIIPLIPTNTGGKVKNALPIVSTFSGTTTPGFVNAIGLGAKYNNPAGVAVDKSGVVYVADKYNHVIRKIALTGEVSTLAGSGLIGSSDGLGTAASFNYPAAVAVDANYNVYVSDQYNNKIRKITPSGLVTTLAGNGWEGATDGQGTAASFYYPEGLVIDSVGNVFVTDFYNHKIRKITPTGLVSTLAGSGWEGSMDGAGTSASFAYPCGITMDTDGSLLVADQRSYKIRRVTMGGVVTTVAGNGQVASKDGTLLTASFNYPSGVVKDASGSIYVTERFGNRIRAITSDGKVKTIAGNDTAGFYDGNYNVAQFNCPFGIALDLSGNLLVADRFNHEIRKIVLTGYSITPMLPAGLKFDNLTGILSGTPISGSAIKTYTITASNAAGTSTTTLQLTITGKSLLTTDAVNTVTSSSAELNGTIIAIGVPNPTAIGFCWNKKGMPTLSDSLITLESTVETVSFSTTLKSLSPGVTYFYRAYSTNSFGTSFGEERSFTTLKIAPNIMYLSPQIYTIGAAITPLAPLSLGGTPSPFPYVYTFAGNGVCASTNGKGLTASFANPSSVAVDAQGNQFVADANTHVIRKITADGVVTTFAGSGSVGSADGVGTASSFYSPRGIAVDAKGNVYVGDTYNNKIRKITKDGVVTTLAGSGTAGKSNGTGTSANFYFPTGVAVDTSGNVYVADKNNMRLCKITPSGVVTTLAAPIATGIGDDLGGVNATFGQPTGVAVDSMGNVYVADYGTNQIYKYTPAGTIHLLAGSGNYSRLDGTGSTASFYHPQGIAVDGVGNVYVAEYSSSSIRQITPTGVVTTLAGSSNYIGFLDGKVNVARFAYPSGIAVDKAGTIFVADYGNNRIRKIGTVNYSISPALPTGLVFDPQTGIISGNPTVATNMTTYAIYAANSGGICNTTIELSTLSSPQALDNLNQDKLTLYPNPATNQIGVKGLTENQLLTVYSLAGVKLLTQVVSNGVTVDVSKLASGVYLVKVGGQELKLVKK